ncbi:MAG: hypothetical protein IPJ65_09795 [Archangiaceae bacterium]|nr:hypothetical protein [Archangiaceae bacterium]
MSKPTPEQLKAWGASLREIDPTSLVQEEGLKVQWYLGDSATELYCWVHDDGRPDHLQLVFSRVSVEWSEKKGLTTGTFQTGGSMAGGRYDPYLLSVGKEVDLEVCEAALVLLTASSIAQPLYAPMVEAVRKALAAAPG